MNNLNYAQAVAASGLAGDASRPEGAFTGRIRMLADQSEQYRAALFRVMIALRCPPPVPGQIGAGSPGPEAVRFRVEDHLQRAESANQEIEAALNELEGLFS